MLGFFKVSPYALKMTSFCMNYCINRHCSGVVAAQVAGIAAFKSPTLLGPVYFPLNNVGFRSGQVAANQAQVNEPGFGTFGSVGRCQVHLEK